MVISEFVLEVRFCTDEDYGTKHKYLKVCGFDELKLMRRWSANDFCAEELAVAVKETVEILTELKKNLGGRDYAVKYVTEMIDNVISDITESRYVFNDSLHAVEGDYSGTYIHFYYDKRDTHDSSIHIVLSNEEYEKLKKLDASIVDNVIDICQRG